METDLEGQKAISKFNGVEVEGRALAVNEARRQQPRSGGGGGYGGGYGGGGSRGGEAVVVAAITVSQFSPVRSRAGATIIQS